MNHSESIGFLLQISVMLTGALTLGQLMRRLGMPAVVGEIVAGILLGPTVFGTWAPGLQASLFPMSGVAAIGREAVVKLGLLCFLFAAGLEMNLSQVWNRKGCVVSTSFFGMLLPFAAGYAMTLWYPGFFQMNRVQPMLPLFLGTALAISALPVIARTLMDLNLQKTSLAATILAAATIDDLIGWGLFAVIVSRISHQSGHSVWLTIGLIVCLATFVLTGGRWIVRRTRPWFRGHMTGLGGLLSTAAVLTLVMAALVEWVGIHGVFGAFLAGLALAQGKEDREPVHEIVHQFALGVFAPVYFVSIGLKVNFSENFDFGLTGVIILVACLGKVIGAGFGAWLGKMRPRDALAVGFGMNARGAMEIILASLALEFHLINDAIFVALVLMALFTSIISGPVLGRLVGLPTPRRHALRFPAADAMQEPSPWWYFGRAVYVSRRDYARIFLAFVALGTLFGILGVVLSSHRVWVAAGVVAVFGFGMFFYSLIGLYRQYGHPAEDYFRTLLHLGQVEGAVVVADLHIGTYRHTYALANALPQATIHSVDCWDVEGTPTEEAIQEVHDLEPAPVGNRRIKPLKADRFHVPLPDASCDVVVLGFGTHEIPKNGPRETVFTEAQRILKPGGKALLFEHGIDLHNYFIFGPVINHVTTKEDWLSLMRHYFSEVRCARTSHAVDLIAGIRHAERTH